MNRLSILIFLFLLTSASETGRAQSRLGRVTRIQLSPDVEVAEAVLRDVSGDGNVDLVISALDLKTNGRSLRIHHRLQGSKSVRECFRQAPDHTLSLTPDVVAFSIADVHEDAGREVVLFSPRGVFVWRPKGSEKERFKKLFSAELLWQVPDVDEVFFWDAARDVNGDGLDDLMLPETGGYRIAVQGRSAEAGAFFQAVSTIQIPEDRRAGFRAGGKGPVQTGGGQGRFELMLGLPGRQDEATRNLVRIEDVVPAPFFLDWDADGDLDLLAQTTTRLHVWPLSQEGQYNELPGESLLSPVPLNQERTLDISYSSHAVDFNQDGRADCVIFAGDKSKKNLRTQVLIFRNSPEKGLFGEKGRPDQLLVLTGIVAPPSFPDVDGDGAKDLLIVTLRTDLIEQLRNSSSDSVSGEISVYLNQGKRGEKSKRGEVFSRRPDFIHSIQMSPEGDTKTTHFLGDVTGDGVAELLLRTSKDHLSVFMIRQRKGELSLVDRPLWELNIDEEANVELPDVEVSKNREFLVLEDHQVLHVRFR